MATTTQQAPAPADREARVTRDPRLSALYEISKILSDTQDLSANFREALTVLGAYVGFSRCSVVLVDRNATPYVVASTDRSLEAGRNGADDYPNAVAADVQRSNMPVLLTGITEDPRLAGYCAHLGQQAADKRAFLAVPLRLGAHAVGALSVDRPVNAPATYDADLRFMRLVANLIAQCLRVHGLPLPDGHAPAASTRHDAGPAAAPARPAGGRAETGRAGLRHPGVPDMVCESPAIRAVMDQVRHVSRTRAPVMLRGESGTGKELVAQWIHRFSPRRQKAFVSVNCATLPENLLESELFGHEKGAFTGANAERKGRFEAAHGGTLFLDEIGDISAAFQAKLLRVLQEGEFERLGSSRTRKVDVRVIAATNRNLEQAVVDGDFRADLYYRINVITILVPPLRERPDDVGPLAHHFVERFNHENGDDVGLSAEAVANLQRCPFPGNVRELENCITRVAALAQGPTITSDDFPCGTAGCLASALWSSGSTSEAAPTEGHTAPAGADERSLAPVAAKQTGLIPREQLIEAMEKAGWVQAKAARLLGVTPRQVRYALYKHGIEVKRI